MTPFPPDRNRDAALDDLLRGVDPGLQEAPVDALQSRWSELGAARRTRRRTGVAVGLIVLSGALLASREQRIANVDPPRQPSRPADVARAGDAPKVAPAPTDVASTVDSPVQDQGSNSTPPHDTTAAAETQMQAVTAPDQPPPQLANSDDPHRAVEAIFRRLDSIEGDDPLQWRQLVAAVHRLPPAGQQAMFSHVAEDGDLSNRRRVMQLMVDAAGPSADPMLVLWLNSDAARRHAWEMLLTRTADGDLQRLVPLAQRPDQREQLCQRIARLRGRAAANGLVHLAQQRSWRPAVAVASQRLDSEAWSRLLELLRDGSSQQRAGAGFVIGAVPGSEVDRQLAVMIAQGRSRQVAYLALLSRRTPAAQQFLYAASRNAELAPALRSAQYGWQSFGPLIHQWLSELEENRYDADSARHPHDRLERRIVAVPVAARRCSAEA